MQSCSALKIMILEQSYFEACFEALCSLGLFFHCTPQVNRGFPLLLVIARSFLTSTTGTTFTIATDWMKTAVLILEFDINTAQIPKVSCVQLHLIVTSGE